MHVSKIGRIRRAVRHLRSLIQRSIDVLGNNHPLGMSRWRNGNSYENKARKQNKSGRPTAGVGVRNFSPLDEGLVDGISLPLPS